MKVEAHANMLPIKMWLDEVEASAMQQAYNLAQLPFAFKHIALMPDCLPENTEVLTNQGFQLIDGLFDDAVVCNYDPITTKVYFSKVRNVIKRSLRSDEKMYGLIECSTDKMIMMSENHRMPLISNMGVLAKDIGQTTERKDYVWSGTGKIDQSDYDISDELLCLIAWVVGDGNIKWSNRRKDGQWSSVNIRFGMNKDRKIRRVISLLEAVDYEYTTTITKKQTTITVHVADSRKLVKYVGETKSYPKMFIEGLSTRQALMFLEECLKVDGDWTNYQNYGTMRYNSKREDDINFLSSLIAMHVGIARDSSRYTEGFQKIKMHYLMALGHDLIYESNNGSSRTKLIKKEVPYTGNLVCIECDSGFFIARQNGITFVTGNCHSGYGMPIGGVLATRDVIIPNAVGVDIGCGMCAVKTSLRVEDWCQGDEFARQLWTPIMDEIRNLIPMGRNHHKMMVSKDQLPDLAPILKNMENIPICAWEFDNARYQLGTLGGGNHFIEVQRGSDGHIWIMLHSGSRNVGYKVAKHYNNVAKQLNEKWHSSVPPHMQLAFLPWGSNEGKNYQMEMQWCVDFALANREYMLDRIKEVFSGNFPDVQFAGVINIAHNYVAMENHFGTNVMVHRKGATRARVGDIGIIPGSMGTKSYIVEGLGNPESFHSCSHGAGRLMSRTAAKENLDLDEQQAILNDKGIVHGVRGRSDLDEAPGAYKSIDIVMDNQKDLVRPIVELEPIAVLKG